MKRLWIPQVICIGMLLWALNPANPYGYYILLRWVLCGAFSFLAVQAINQGKQGWLFVFGITALIYNPFLRVHLTREIWTVVNVVTIVLVVASIFVIEKNSFKKSGKHDSGTSRY